MKSFAGSINQSTATNIPIYKHGHVSNNSNKTLQYIQCIERNKTVIMSEVYNI